ncbi:FAD-binding protein [Streptomyces sp. HU2014]|uniref:FAD-binding PCMH-type domain-containing protein n=1 Tax=Streptomyces albireticuli TaxID=1940 RepID=A0A1Z2KWD2_9ACTN|nr:MULTISPECIES: FAD-binding protein [Streptomyces]ARZ66349.1 hypothetical protein SMD11_0683 [Streptomyces albireticuli]UQI46574.1 FAD-binding protein [Streptomyces sp. HU2014]
MDITKSEQPAEHREISPPEAAAVAVEPVQSIAAPFRAVQVTPDDPRYPELVSGNDKRWVAAPQYVHVVGNSDQVLHAVDRAARAGQRVSVRGGGHSYAPFVYHPETEVIIDLSLMYDVYYCERRRAFAVEGGAKLGRIYEWLFKGWGVTLPGGVCPGVGIGGHASGGGYGLLSRKFGYVVDHLEAVEMVVVGRDRRARRITASRNPDDPNHDLWWAVTGGGGGNFGIVTRYWFRSPGRREANPSAQLPRPPKDVLLSVVPIPWSDLDRTGFTHLVRNFGTWHERNKAPDSPYTSLTGVVFLQHKASQSVNILTQIDAGIPHAEELLTDYLSAITQGTKAAVPPAQKLSWLDATELIGTSNPTLMTSPAMRSAVKSAYMRKGFTDAQIGTLYEQMTRDDYTNPHATLQLTGVAGGRINAVDPHATASAHRDSAFLALFENYWQDPREDDHHMGWLRDIYHTAFDSTGGYPVPNEQSDGCYINSPDTDIKDPRFNRSGVPWHALYYKDNYRRLQRAKARFDPTDFFRHAQSVELPHRS